MKIRLNYDMGVGNLQNRNMCQLRDQKSLNAYF